jgi:hypothetical protein
MQQGLRFSFEKPRKVQEVGSPPQVHGTSHSATNDTVWYETHSLQIRISWPAALQIDQNLPTELINPAWAVID